MKTLNAPHAPHDPQDPQDPQDPHPAPATAHRHAHWRALAFTTLLAGFVGLGAGPQSVMAATEGSGHVTSEVRKVGDFSGIALRGSMNLVVRQGDKASVTVRADDKLLPLLQTVVEGSRLVIGWKKGERLDRSSGVTVTVVSPRLADLALAGSGDADVGAFNTPALKLSVAGAGHARLVALKTDELTVSVSGSGDVRGSGQAGKIDIRIAGSGDVDLGDLPAPDVAVRIAGSGDAAVQADKTLAVSIAGSGDVVYSGAATVTRSVAGSGSVKKR